jgi:hypothetical protein
MSYQRCLVMKDLEIFFVGETEIYFIGYEDLIVNKMKTGRPKDLNDIEQLKRIKNSGSAD